MRHWSEAAADHSCKTSLPRPDLVRRHAVAAAALLTLTAGGASAQDSNATVVRTRVSVHEGTALQGVLSPDGRKIAIILLGSVHIVDRASGVAEVLTDPATEPDEYDGLAWSPDGTKLALHRGWWPEALVVADLTTGARATVTTRHFAKGDIAWSRAHGVMALVPRGDSVDLVSYDPVEGAPGTVLATLERTAARPAPSPDGTQLAYETRTNAAWLPASASQLAVLTLATGATLVLGEQGTFDGFPAWSPDGSAIAFISRRGGARRLWLMDGDGREPRPLVPAEDSTEWATPSWTPDGRSILFVSRGRLRSVAVDGAPSAEVPFSAWFEVARWTGLRRPNVPQPGTRLQAQGILDPELSPDGRSVIFSALGDLWIAPATGGDPDPVVETPGPFESTPHWSRDGARVAYLAVGPGRDPVLRIRTLASGRDTAFALPLLPTAMAWSPEGRQIAVAAGNFIGWLDTTTGALRLSGPQAADVSAIAGWTAGGDSVVFAAGREPVDSVYLPGAPRFFRVSDATGATGVAWTPPAPIELEDVAWSGDLSLAAFTVGGQGYWMSMTDLRQTPIEDPTPTGFSWSADGSLLGYLSGGRYRLLDVGTGVAVTADIAPGFTVQPAPPPVLIRNVRVIDGTGSERSGPRDVLLRGGRIARVADAGTLDPESDQDVIDGSGMTLMPGLFDMHQHMDGASISGPSPGFLYYGVLAVRDLGTPAQRAISMRERGFLGSTLAPRLFTSAGRLAYARRQADLMPDWQLAPVADTAEIAMAARAFKDNGSDILKLYDRNSGFQARASAAAHAVGLPVTSHVTSPGAAYHGIEGHEHSSAGFGPEWTAPWRDDVIGITRAAGTCVTPTLVTYLGNLRRRGAPSPVLIELEEFSASPFLPPWVRRVVEEEWSRTGATEMRDDWERWFREDMASMLRLHRAGVRVVTGTDGWPEGQSLHWELQLFVRAGFTPLETIRAATLDAASCLGVDEVLGSVTEGKIADLILVSGDPSVRIEDTARIETVFLGGKPISRTQLLDLVRHE